MCGRYECAAQQHGDVTGGTYRIARDFWPPGPFGMRGGLSACEAVLSRYRRLPVSTGSRLATDIRSAISYFAVPSHDACAGRQ